MSPLSGSRAVSGRHVALTLAVLCCAALAVGVAPRAAMAQSWFGGPNWPSAGHDLSNTRVQPGEFRINVGDVGRLAPKWVFTTHGDVSATPTVDGGAVYFPDSGGYLNAVNASNGSLLWQARVPSYTGVANAASRVSPAVDGDRLISGDNFFLVHPGGAHVFAVNRFTGKLLWSTQVESNPAAIITSNPVVYGNEVVVGVSSNEEDDALFSFYPCCTFRGSVVALSADTGQILWKTYTVPVNAGPCTVHSPPAGCGYSGGAVWDAPAIDPATDSVYVGTGNNYTVPDAAAACQAAAVANKMSDDGCTSPDDHFDSALSLNLQTGQINWSHKVEGWDAWNFACFLGTGVSWCPSIAGDDYDFSGSGPNLMQTGGRTLVGLGQKSGVYWAFDATNGNLVWDTLVGPGGVEGGIQWGTAYDGRRLYVPIANAGGTAYQLASGQPAKAGSWAALDPATGKIIWQVADPNGSADIGPVSEANGVLFGASAAWFGNKMFALDAATGRVLWGFPSAGSVWGGTSIVNGTVYWGSGYYQGLPSNKFYAFSVGGR